jgi:YVTN family beta-propeller protein
MRKSLFIFLGLAFFLSCGKLEHKSPYDPDSPLSLQAKGKISGRVILEESDDNSGVIVSLKGTSLTSISDKDGNWAITEVPQGRYTIAVSKENWEYSEPMDAEVGIGEEVFAGEIFLKRLRGSLSGKIVLEEAEEHSGALISVQGTPFAGFSNRDGNFIISGVPTGTYDILISRSGYEEKELLGVKVSANSIIDVGGGSPISILLQRGEVEGYAFLEGESDHSGILVSVEGSGKTGITDSYGHYIISLIPVGKYNITFTKDRFEKKIITDVVVSKNQTTPVEDVLMLVSRGSIIGKASLEGSSDHSGILITVEGTSYTGMTNSSGDYLIQNIPVGTYNLVATKYGYEGVRVSNIQVEANKTTSAPSITLNFIPGQIKGVALKEGKNTHANIHVYLEGYSYLDAFTDLNGNFTITDVPAGTYSLVAIAPEPDYVVYYHPEPVVVYPDGGTTDVGTFTVKRPPYPPIPFVVYQSGITSATIKWYPNNPTDELIGFNIYYQSYEDPSLILLNSEPIPPSGGYVQTYSTSITEEEKYHFFSLSAIDKDNLESNRSEKLGFELMPYSSQTIKDSSSNPFNLPFAIAMDRDSENVFVTNSGAPYVSVINTSTESVTSTVVVTGTPQGIVASPVADAVYVGIMDTGFQIINTKTLEVSSGGDDLAIGEHRLTITPDGLRLFVSADEDDMVFGWDLSDPFSPTSISGCDPCDLSGGGVYSTCMPKEMAVAKNKLYVMCYQSKSIRVIDIDEGGLSPYQVIKDIPSLENEYLTATSDGNYIVVSNTFYSGNPGPDTVSIYDTSNDELIGMVDVGNMPRGLAATRNGVYVVHDTPDASLFYIGFNHLEVYLYDMGPAGNIRTPGYCTAITSTSDRKKVYIVRGTANEVIVQWSP